GGLGVSGFGSALGSALGLASACGEGLGGGVAWLASAPCFSTISSSTAPCTGGAATCPRWATVSSRIAAACSATDTSTARPIQIDRRDRRTDGVPDDRTEGRRLIMG